MSAYSEPYQACLDWPRPAHTAPVVNPASTPLPASVPVLVVGGDLDSLTPVSDAPLFVPGLGANTRVIPVPNTVHVDSQGYTPLLNGTRCVRKIIRAYLRAPAAMASLNAACTAGVPPVHTPGSYPVRLADAIPATLVSGPDPGVEVRRAVTVAAGALADATVRYFYSGAARGPGLRGGSFTVRGDAPARFTLRRVQFVRDATVDGRASWRPSSGAAAGTLSVELPNDAKVRVRVSWTQRTRFARARVAGATFTLPAP